MMTLATPQKQDFDHGTKQYQSHRPIWPNSVIQVAAKMEMLSSWKVSVRERSEWGLGAHGCFVWGTPLCWLSKDQHRSYCCDTGCARDVHCNVPQNMHWDPKSRTGRRLRLPSTLHISRKKLGQGGVVQLTTSHRGHRNFVAAPERSPAGKVAACVILHLAPFSCIQTDC